MTEEFLNEIENQLYIIHSKLFGSAINISDLKVIKEELNEYEVVLKEISMYDAKINKSIKIIGKLFQILKYLSSMLIILLVLLNSLHILLGIIWLIFINYSASSIKKAQMQVGEDSITLKLNKLLSDIEYKKDIVNKRINRLSKCNLNIYQDKKLFTSEKTLNKNQTLIRKLEK